jgi:hypothetical protein
MRMLSGGLAEALILRLMPVLAFCKENIFLAELVTLFLLLVGVVAVLIRM